MARPSRYPLELRRRAVRMFAEVRGDYPTETAALQSVVEKLDIGFRETLRNWVKQHEIDAGQHPGMTTEESAQIKALKKENAELKRANDMLQAVGIAASIGSVGDAYDNALMESTIDLYKTEQIKPRRPWKTLSQVELATA